jgi:hypothetical protein
MPKDKPAMKISLSRNFTEPGGHLFVQVEGSDIGAYGAIEICISPAAVRNPRATHLLRTPVVNGVARCPIQTEHLAPGYYEIALLRLLPLFGLANPVEEKVGLCGQDFSRKIFEVTSNKAGITPEALVEIVAAKEMDLQKQFESGIVLPGTSPQNEYRALCLISGMLIPADIQFQNWEVLKHAPMDGYDVLASVNAFVKEFSAWTFGQGFNYDDALKAQFNCGRPVCVVHFPKLIANDMEQARTFCIDRSRVLSECLCLNQGGAGKDFCIVMVDLKEKAAKLWVDPGHFGGNLLGGAFGTPAELEAMCEKLEAQPRLRYFVSLYKEARQEPDVSYQYLRFWQLLETIAETKNYPVADVMICLETNAPLLDSNGTPRTIGKTDRNGDHPDSKMIVYRLITDVAAAMRLRNASLLTVFGDAAAISYDLQKYVNSWHAMRNAAAHFGRFVLTDPTQQARFRDFSRCQALCADQGNSRDGFVSMQLRHVVELVLGEELRSAPNP